MSQSEDDGRREYLKDMEACYIGHGNKMSTTVLAHTVTNCHVASECPERRKIMSDAVYDFFAKGNAVIIHGNTEEFFKPCNIVRLFPVPKDFGFLLCTSAREYCAHALTPCAADRIRNSSDVLPIYTRAVQHVMDVFGIPESTYHPVDAAKGLVESFKTLKGTSHYNLCTLFYRLLASTYFLNIESFHALSRVFSAKVIDVLTKQYPKETCQLRKVVNYESFITELQTLGNIYHTKVDIALPPSEGSDSSEREDDEYIKEEEADTTDDNTSVATQSPTTEEYVENSAIPMVLTPGHVHHSTDQE